MGAFSGFNAAAIALVATDTPEELLGYAMGLLQIGQVAGTVMGRCLGGCLPASWVITGFFT